MARRTTKKKGPTPEEEAKEFFTALDMIEQEKGISKAYMMEKITQALVSAYKRDHEGAEENIVVLTDPEKNSVRIIAVSYTHLDVYKRQPWTARTSRRW